MADTFNIIPYVVRSAGTDVPPEEVQAGINSLARQTTVALNAIVGSPEPPSGPAGGDLSGTYPNPTVAAVHATSGTMSGVTVNNSSIGQTTPAAGAFTTLTATTPVSVTSGGTGVNALTANAVLVGTGSSAVSFASPGVLGTILSSGGVSVPPAFQSASSLFLAQTTNPLSQFASTTSAQLASVISDETGTAGSLVFSVSPALTGTPTAPTAASHTNTTQLATTAFVESEFASPPAIGSGTPAAGTFTSLSSTSGALNGTLGATTPSTVAATTIIATGTITPSQTNGIVGTTTNNSANAGSVGEFVTATGSAVALTSGVSTNITSISLTAGDWDVQGNVIVVSAATTVFQNAIISVNDTSATDAASPDFSRVTGVTYAVNATYSNIAPIRRFSLASTTTIYLVCTPTFATSTATASGRIRARRMR